MSLIKRSIFYTLQARIQEPRRFIQVLLGPRQVGKTTLVRQLIETSTLPCHYVTADVVSVFEKTWIKTQWEIARQKSGNAPGLLIIDEVQKILNWSNEIKALWDQDTYDKRDLKVILLGSSPWLMQKGLTESLAGRFEIIPVTHWFFPEMQQAFQWTLTEYAYFGAYPGAASLANKPDITRWLNYINDSLIETTISRDILLMSQVNKPALLRSLFQLACIYSGQILSYQKMLGQLQDAGNTTTLAHYLELLAGAGLIASIPKYSKHVIRQRASSPKLQVMNTALMTAQLGMDYQALTQNREVWGRLMESVVGAYLLNAIRGTDIKVYYWREGNYEVDFILKKGNKLTAIEVKSAYKKEKLSGLEKFNQVHKPNKTLCVGEQGVSIEEFICKPIQTFFA
jgi:hypothetical protein